MKTRNATQKLVQKLIKRHSMYSKPLQYELVAEQLKITPRWVRYLANGEKEPSSHLAELIKLLSQ